MVDIVVYYGGGHYSIGMTLNLTGYRYGGNPGMWW